MEPLFTLSFQTIGLLYFTTNTDIDKKRTKIKLLFAYIWLICTWKWKCCFSCLMNIKSSNNKHLEPKHTSK